MRGRDRGGVEVGDRLAPAGRAARHLGVGPSASSCTTPSSSWPAAPASDVDSPSLGAHEPLADPLAQLARRHPRERDDQQLVDRHALGDERAVSAAIVNVLPVPALASSSVTPLGSGPQRSNGRVSSIGAAAHRSITSSRAQSPSHSRRAYTPEPRRLDGSQPALVRPRRAGSVEQLGEGHVPPSTSRCSGSASSLGSSSRTSTPSRRPPSRRAPRRRRGVRGRGLAVERQRLAHAALEEVDEHVELRARAAALRLAVVGPERPMRATVTSLAAAAAAPAERDRLEGRVRARGGEREQVHPRGQPRCRAETRVGHRADHVAADAGHRPTSARPARVDHARRRSAAAAGSRLRRRGRELRRRPVTSSEHRLGEQPRRQRARGRSPPRRSLAGSRRRAAPRAAARRRPTAPARRARSACASSSRRRRRARETPSRSRRNARTGCWTNPHRAGPARSRSSSQAGSGPVEERRARRGAALRQRPRTVEMQRGRSSTGRRATSAPAVKLRGSNGCSGCSTTTRSRGRPPANATVRSIDVEQLADRDGRRPRAGWSARRGPCT